MLVLVWALLQDRHLELVNPRLFWYTGIWRLDLWKPWMSSTRPKGTLKPRAMLKKASKKGTCQTWSQISKHKQDMVGFTKLLNNLAKSTDVPNQVSRGRATPPRGGPSFEKLLAAAGFVLAWLAVQKAMESTLVPEVSQQPQNSWQMNAYLRCFFNFLALNKALSIRKSSLRGGGLGRPEVALQRTCDLWNDPTYIVLFSKDSAWDD